MRWLITGASGTLGSHILRALRSADDTVVAWTGNTSRELFGVTTQPVDLMNDDAVATAFAVARPDAVIHAGAAARVDLCLHSPDRAQQINVGGTRRLAGLCAASRTRLVYVSSDLVFDGEHAPYREADPPNPLSQYGATKSAGEAHVHACPRGLVARISLLFGAAINGRPGFHDTMIDRLKTSETTVLFDDEWRTPMAVNAAADALIALARSDVAGTIHVGGPERLSRLDMGRRLAARLGASPDHLVAGRRDSVRGAEARPRDVSLDSSYWRSLFPTSAWPRFEDACS